MPNGSNGNAKSTRRSPPPNAATVTTIARRLRTSAYASAMQEVRCEAETGAIVLRGRVSSFYLKQLAQEVVRKADGACRIVNELEVEDQIRYAAKDQANGESKSASGPSLHTS